MVYHGFTTSRISGQGYKKWSGPSDRLGLGFMEVYSSLDL